MATKHYATVEVKSIDDGSDNGAFEAILSAPTMDRDGEVIDYGAFEPLPSSIPILADHDASVRSLVGRATPFYDGNVLKVRGYFASNDLAQLVRGLITDGALTSMSVGFMNPTYNNESGTPHITKGEILEGSFVVVPSNRQAAIVMARGFGLSKEIAELAADDLMTKAGARNSTTDQAALDAAHNHIVKAGAYCPSSDIVSKPVDDNDPLGDPNAPGKAFDGEYVAKMIDAELALLDIDA